MQLQVPSPFKEPNSETILRIYLGPEADIRLDRSTLALFNKSPNFSPDAASILDFMAATVKSYILSAKAMGFQFPEQSVTIKINPSLQNAAEYSYNDNVIFINPRIRSWEDFFQSLCHDLTHWLVGSRMRGLGEFEPTPPIFIPQGNTWMSGELPLDQIDLIRTHPTIPKRLYEKAMRIQNRQLWLLEAANEALGEDLMDKMLADPSLSRFGIDRSKIQTTYRKEQFYLALLTFSAAKVSIAQSMVEKRGNLFGETPPLLGFDPKRNLGKIAKEILFNCYLQGDFRPIFLAFTKAYGIDEEQASHMLDHPAELADFILGREGIEPVVEYFKQPGAWSSGVVSEQLSFVIKTHNQLEEASRMSEIEFKLKLSSLKSVYSSMEYTTKNLIGARIQNHKLIDEVAYFILSNSSLPKLDFDTAEAFSTYFIYGMLMDHQKLKAADPKFADEVFNYCRSYLELYTSQLELLAKTYGLNFSGFGRT